ncbi:MAG: hypothetical protein JWO20_2907 [Candidatus Angelobacter sp.]|nr:hypothetical protein [Candidatus Angelobacter sp.]
MSHTHEFSSVAIWSPERVVVDGDEARAARRAKLRLTIVLAVSALLLGVFQAVLNRDVITPDGISYLDMGDSIVRGDWSTAINGYWSPLYPALLGSALALVKPAMRWEFSVVHLVNLFIYIGALAAFYYYWSQLGAFRPQSDRGNADQGSDSVWLLLGFALCTSALLGLITVAAATPDLTVAAMVFLAAGLIVSIHPGDRSWGKFILLGLVLGLAYLAKTVMFLLGLLFLLVVLFRARPLRSSLPRTFLAASVFLLVSMPWIVALSHSKGRVTFGDSGGLNYAWQVDHVQRVEIPEQALSGQIKLLHPARMIPQTPPIYVMSGWRNVTYPFWYDASYWLDGVRPHFQLRDQLLILPVNIAREITCWAQLEWGALILLLFLLQGSRSWRRETLYKVAEQWHLLILGTGALVLYSLVHVEPRYLAPFTVLFWSAFLVCLRKRTDLATRRVLMPIGLVAAILTGVSIFFDSAVESYRMRNLPTDGSVHYQVAEGLRRMGIKPGDEVAYIGDTYYAGWARLLRVSVIAEIPLADESRFWADDPSEKTRILEELAATGAKIVISDAAPAPDPASQWQQIAATRYYAHRLNSTTFISQK